MKIRIRRHLKRLVLTLVHMGFYDPEWDDILPDDVYVLDSVEARNPFSESFGKPDKEHVAVIAVKDDHVQYRHLYVDRDIESLPKRDFLKKYFRDK
jgi:hypothetical protein